MKHVVFLSRIAQNIYKIQTEVSPRIKKSQNNDSLLMAVKDVLVTWPYENYKIKDEIIFKTIGGSDLLAVPKSMEQEIILDAHNNGHFALQKTMHAIQKSCWIPHLESKVS